MPTFARQRADFVARLTSRVPCNEADARALAAAIALLDPVKPRTDLVRQGEPSRHLHLLIEGFAARYKLNAAGDRQILFLHLPGEVLDFHGLHLGIADHGIATLSRSRIARLPHAAAHTLMRRHPGLAQAFFVDAFIDAAITREWLLNIGRRDTYTRVAHLLCELTLRMRAIGRFHDGSFDFPVTQIELADAMSVSSVHMNRAIQLLRSEGLVSIDGKTITIHDWERLAEVSDFDPAYLYLDGQPGSAAWR